MYGDPHHYLMHIPELFRAFGTSSFKAGAAERTVDGLGVALWLPPGIHATMSRLRRLLQKAWFATTNCCDAQSLKFYEGISMSKLTPNQQTILATWQQHTYAEFVLKDANAALATMTNNPYVSMISSGVGASRRSGCA